MLNQIQRFIKYFAMLPHSSELLKNKRCYFHVESCLSNKALVKKNENIFIPAKITLKKPENLTLSKKISKKLLEFVPRKTVDKYRLIQATYVTYEQLMEEVQINEFFEEFNMPDTFASWFTVAELHVYILSARLMKEEDVEKDHGMQTRDILTDTFWKDADYRSRSLGPGAHLNRKKQMLILTYQFEAAFYGYDEGIQSNDMVLAAVIWRRFFGFHCEDAEKIERLVKYIRVQKLQHNNIIQLLEVFKKKKRFYLVFEYLDRTVLNELEENPNGLDEKRVREYTFQLICAIEYCHNKNVIHRDIKPENLLISSIGILKLCDFGFARVLRNLNGCYYTEYIATRWYRAPELLVLDRKYGKPIDIWAIGCVFAELFVGEPLFPGGSDIDQLHQITTKLGMLIFNKKLKK
ncbi:hypothetical protein PGB90_006449 [Kerria lacca]